MFSCFECRGKRRDAQGLRCGDGAAEGGVTKRAKGVARLSEDAIALPAPPVGGWCFLVILERRLQGLERVFVFAQVVECFAEHDAQVVGIRLAFEASLADIGTAASPGDFGPFEFAIGFGCLQTPGDFADVLELLQCSCQRGFFEFPADLNMLRFDFVGDLEHSGGFDVASKLTIDPRQLQIERHIGRTIFDDVFELLASLEWWLGGGTDFWLVVATGASAEQIIGL